MRRAMVLCGLLALSALQARGDDVPHFGVDGARTRSSVEVLGTPAALGPAVLTGEEAIVGPVVADGVVVLVSLDGTLRAYREADRSSLWTAELGATVLAAPAVDRGRVYVSCLDGRLRIRRLADGADLGWIVTGSADLAPPLADGGRLYLASGFPETRLRVLDLPSGAEAGSAPLENVANAAAALAPGRVLAACNSGRLVSVDPATFVEQWSLGLGGNPASAAPAVSGSSVFVLSENVLHRVTLSGTADGSLAVEDPAPPPGVFSVERAGSSLAIQGGKVAGVVRFTYAFDANADGYADDARTVREVAFAADEATLTLAWSSVLGYANLSTFNELPPYRIVPSPAAVGGAFAVASGVSPLLRLLDSITGAPAFSVNLGDGSVGSPVFANGRLHAVTRGGAWHSFQGANVPPAAVVGLSPDGVDVQSSPVTLSWTPSLETGVTYRVRVDDDGEVLEDWAFETTVGVAMALTPPLSSGRLHTWSVRVRDAGGAWGPWSTPATFGQDVPPAPPGSFSAEARHGRVLLSWTASPSNDVTGYRLRTGPPGGPPGPPAELGPVLQSEVGGLINGTTYEFTLTAVDVAGNESSTVSVTAAPRSAISISGTPYDTLAGALASAQPGDVVQLGADVFRTEASLAVPPGVELRGVDARLTWIQASGDFTVLEVRAGATVRRLAVEGGRTGISVPEGPATLANLVVRGASGAGVSTAGTLSVVNCTLVDNGGAGVASTGSASVRNSVTRGNGVGLEGAVDSSYSSVADGYSGTSAGPGNTSVAVTFRDAASGDYREAERSAAVDAGDPADPVGAEPEDNGDRVNLGAFGGTESAMRTSATVLAPEPGDHANPVPSCSGATGPEGAAWPVLVALLSLLALSRRRA